jgi:CheY-like chemotaxis protein
MSYLELLLIEDNPTDAELAIRALRKKHPNLPIIHAPDGQEALDLVLGQAATPKKTRKQPGLILLDLKLPKINGLQVLEKLKQNEQTRSIPVIVLSSSNEISDIENSYRLGANSFITKPVNFEAYEQVITTLANYWLELNQLPIL